MRKNFDRKLVEFKTVDGTVRTNAIIVTRVLIILIISRFPTTWLVIAPSLRHWRIEIQQFILAHVSMDKHFDYALKTIDFPEVSLLEIEG